MQRRRLLLAMRELSGEVGLAGATVGQVCRRSRMSRRTFYELFDSRDDCFLAAFEQALEQVNERVVPAVWQPSRPGATLKSTRTTKSTRQGGCWRDRIRGGLEALLVFFDEEPQLARLCIVETLTGGPAVLVRRREILDRLAVVIDEGRNQARKGNDGAPPPLTAEGTVGGVLAVIHARLEDPESGPLAQLAPSLCSMIVFPYLGLAAAQHELDCPATQTARMRTPTGNGHPGNDPFRDPPLRFTYRTARVLATIAAHPGASNRHIGEDAGMTDQGQTSKLLKRLENTGLIKNDGPGRESGEPNAWRLTTRGHTIQTTLGAGKAAGP
jgi:AcrR family transcriptional regulator